MMLSATTPTASESKLRSCRAGWRARCVRVDTEGAVGWCLSPVDLAISKLAAGRSKDIEFVGGMLEAGFLETADVERAFLSWRQRRRGPCALPGKSAHVTADRRSPRLIESGGAVAGPLGTHCGADRWGTRGVAQGSTPPSRYVSPSLAPPRTVIAQTPTPAARPKSTPSPADPSSSAGSSRAPRPGC